MARLLQTSWLLQCPNEILLQIIELFDDDSHPEATAQWFKALSQTCFHLCKLAYPYYARTNDYTVFYKALRTAKVDMMDHYEHYNAAPIDKVWWQPSAWWQPGGRPYTSMDVLLSNLNEGWTRADLTPRQTAISDRIRDRVFNSLKWLLERGADGATWNCTSRAWECRNGCPKIAKPGHMSTMLLKYLQLGTTKHGMNVIFNMIQMLSNHGFPNPTRADSVRYDGNIQTIKSIGADQLWYNDMIAKSTYISSSPLGLAMKSHVIPAVLDLMLSEHASRDLKLRDWHDVCPPSLAKLAKEDKCRQAVSVAWFGITYASVSWVEVTYIHELLRTLHADLHSKWTNWEESYSSEVADIFHEKLELMIKYEMIDSSEEALLKSIEHALYDIAKEGMPTGRYDRELVKRSWEILGKAVMPFATDDNLVQHPSTAPGVNGPGRIHRYAISSKWNPWKDWFIREDVTERYNPEDSSSVDPGTWVGAGHYQNDVIGHLLDELPDWHTMSLDTWCHIARFEVETDIKQRQELHDGPVLSDAIETETSI